MRRPPWQGADYPRPNSSLMPLVAGVDSSTQACCIVLRDLDGGRIVASAEAPHPPAMPPASEQDPAAWWQALQSAARQLDLRDVVAVSVDGQGHGLVVLDRNGEVIRPAKLWNDTTASTEARDLVELLGPEAWSRRTGIVPRSAITIAKLLWLKRHEARNFDRLATLLLPPSYLTYRLTGSYGTDRSEGSGTGYMDIASSAWDIGILDLVDPNVDWRPLLPHIAGPIEAVGRVTASAAAATGFPEGAVVGPGANDQPVSALALGVIGDEVIVSLGTSGTVSARSAVPLVDPSGAVQCVADAAGAFRPLVCTLNATRVSDAFARMLGVGFDELARLALAAPSDASRPLLLPYLDGERTPDRPHARGVLVGLGADASREQLARAGFEGVICGLLEGLDALRAVGTPAAGRMIVTGGGASSMAYRQLLADLAERSVHVADLAETSASGVAVQAAAVLLGQPIEDVAAAWAPTLEVAAEPRPGQEVGEVRARYRHLASLRELDPDHGGGLH
jgi:xylulokinase